MLKNKKGFTLIELMVVVIIITTLAMLALPRYFLHTEMARAREAIDYARLWQGARSIYYASHEEYPSSLSVSSLSISDFSNSHYFNTDTSSNSYILFRRKNGEFSIMATDSSIKCCYPTNNAEGQKICDGLAAPNAIASASDLSGNNCKGVED